MKWRFHPIPGSGRYSQRVDLSVMFALVVVTFLLAEVISRIAFYNLTWLDAVILLWICCSATIGFVWMLNTPTARSWSMRVLYLGVLPITLSMVAIGGITFTIRYFHTRKFTAGWDYTLFFCGCGTTYLVLWAMLRARLRTVVARRLRRQRARRWLARD